MPVNPKIGIIDDDDDDDNYYYQRSRSISNRRSGWGFDERTGAWSFCPEDPQRDGCGLDAVEDFVFLAKGKDRHGKGVYSYGRTEEEALSGLPYDDEPDAPFCGCVD